MISAVDFGYGGAGKLSSIMGCLPELKFVAYGTALGRPILPAMSLVASYPKGKEGSLAAIVRRHRIEVALVALDPELAETLEALGVRVVFVDSLPFLWTHRDPVAMNATAYCAQNFTALPRPCWSSLRGISHLHWVPAIVPSVPPDRPVGGRPRGRALINLGGLASPAAPGGGRGYSDLIAQAALRALVGADYREVLVVGNVDRLTDARDHRIGDTEVHYRRLTHANMQAAIGTAELVLTSPGLTTTLELGATDVPVVYLPPQNLSQILIAEALNGLCEAGCVTNWPRAAIDVRRLEEARQDSEQAALKVIYTAIAELADDPNADRLVCDEIAAAIAARCAHDTSRLLLDTVGSGGAAAVADVVRHTIRTVRPPP